MPEDKAPAPQAAEAPEISAREALEDTLSGFSEPTEKAPAGPEAPAADEGDEVDKIVSEIEPGAEQSAETTEVQVDESEEILREREPKTDEDKSKVQLRIDRLTAEKKALEEQVTQLKAQKEGKEDKPRVYTDAELKTALKKAFEEQDHELVWDIMQVQRKQDRESLIKMYNDEKSAGSEAAKRVSEEWLSIKDQHAKYVDPKMPEIFPGSKEALNLDDENSLLYRVANGLYWSKDAEKAKYYRGQTGGQKLAVSDALAAILTRYMSKGGKTKKIECQLIKEKRKKTIVGEGAMETEEKPPKAPADPLEEVLNERRKFQSERGR